jgi:hypothetical protein
MLVASTRRDRLDAVYDRGEVVRGRQGGQQRRNGDCLSAAPARADVVGGRSSEVEVNFATILIIYVSAETALGQAVCRECHTCATSGVTSITSGLA